MIACDVPAASAIINSADSVMVAIFVMFKVGLRMYIYRILEVYGVATYKYCETMVLVLKEQSDVGH